MSEAGSNHEGTVGHEGVKRGSDRAFGFVFSAVFALIGLWPLFGNGGGCRCWSLSIAALFLVVAVFAASWLAPLNRGWFQLGLALHRVMTPIILGLIYVTTVVPVGLIMRATGSHSLKSGFDPAATTYWIERNPPGPAPEDFDRQF